MTPESTKAAADIIAEEIAKRPFAEWRETFATLEGQWAPIQSPLELASDRQVIANGYLRPVIDADGNEQQLIANPVQFNNEPAELTRAPQFAEHTDEILGQLGYDMDKIIELKLTGSVT